MEDPTGTTVSQWTNLTTSHGIHQLELQLSSEPVQVVIKSQSMLHLIVTSQLRVFVPCFYKYDNAGTLEDKNRQRREGFRSARVRPSEI